MLKVGIVGCGNIFTMHATSAHHLPNAQIVGVCDVKKDRADKAAAKYGVQFLYRDFRPGFRAGQQEARDCELYMQKYCGCVFSEEDRYQKQIQKDLKEPEKHL